MRKKLLNLIVILIIDFRKIEVNNKRENLF